MTFAHPERLVLAVLAVAAFVLAYRAVERGNARQAYTYSNLQFATAALHSRRWPGAALLVALLAGVLLLTSAFAGPRLTVRVPVKDVTVMLCIDTSGSMRATDLQPSRAAAAKAAARAFLDGVPAGARVGVVAFATDAVLTAQPTDDLDAVRASLERLPPPNGATAIGEAIALATQQLPKHGTRAIVLMTDGISNRGIDPVSAAREAGAAGVTVHTVGVGTSGSGQLIPGTDEPADIDVDTLRAISDLSHGTYAPAPDAGALSSAFRRLAAATVWERRRISGSTIFAAGGGAIVLLAFIAGFAAGKFP